MIDKKADCVINVFAVIGERLARPDEIREFMLRKADCLPAVSFEGGLLPPKFCIGFGSRFVELPSTSPGPKIEDEFVSRMMPVWTNCELGRFHEQMVAYRQLAVNPKFLINHHFICNSNVFKYQPAWRNWQTRWTQNPVIARSCGFEPLRRQTSCKVRRWAFDVGR